ncbi:MAG: hypothetical protein CMM10_17345 [Rhodospirillaceae bacterium]|nr:hypothetical protein [Rhodospirillaceae bacterium]
MDRSDAQGDGARKQPDRLFSLPTGGGGSGWGGEMEAARMGMAGSSLRSRFGGAGSAMRG